MTTETTSGDCRLCGRSFGKRQMTAHLKSCWKQNLALSPAKSAGSWLHLVAEGSNSPGYWLHLQASEKTTFGQLDSVLRRIWLKCCGDMSGFKFPVKRPSFRGAGRIDILTLMDRVATGSMSMEDGDDDDLMDRSLKSKLVLGVTFSHEYDFGSTTTLGLRVAGEYSGPATVGAIKVLARNQPPAIVCAVCKKPATQVCTECSYGGAADFCDACAKEHACGMEMLLTLVNSPRAGVCGYCGPSVEP